jgi:hypothetical protein
MIFITLFINFMTVFSKLSINDRTDQLQGETNSLGNPRFLVIIPDIPN